MNHAAFSWMTAVEQKELFSLKKAFSRFKEPVESTKLLVEIALQKHHFLMNCFCRFRQAIHSRKAERFRRRKLLDTCFRSWINHNLAITVAPVQSGVLVSACFKWIARTSELMERTFLSHKEHESHDYTDQGLFLAATYPQLLPHICACKNMYLPTSKIPMLLHACAILDANLLQKYFRFWRCRAKSTRQQVDSVIRRQSSFLLRSSFRNWNILSILRNYFRRHDRRLIQLFLMEWRCTVRATKQKRILLLFCTDIGVLKSRKQVLRRLKVLRDNRKYAKTTFEKAVVTMMKRNLILKLREWRRRVRRRKEIRYASLITLHKKRFSSIQLTFGVWLLHAAKRVSMKRNANSVVILRFHNLAKNAYLSWKHAWDNALRRKTELQIARKERAALLQKKLIESKTIHIFNVLICAWKVWRTLFRLRKSSRVLNDKNVLMRKYAAFKKWNQVRHMSCIANFVGKFWRGYRVRYKTHRCRAKYLRWIFSGRLKAAIRFSSFSLKSKSFRKWKVFINSYQYKREHYSQLVLQMRSLRMWKNSLMIKKNLELDVNKYATVFKRQQLGKCLLKFKSFTLYKTCYKISCDHFKANKLSVAFCRLFSFCLSSRCGFSSTGRRMLQNAVLHDRVLNLPQRLCIVKWRYFSRWRNKFKLSDGKFMLKCFADKHYKSSLKAKGFQLFKSRLKEYNNHHEQQLHLNSMGCNYRRHSILSRYCSHFRNSVGDRRLQLRRIQRRYLRPIFKIWYAEYRRSRRYSRKIFAVKVRIMRRICKNVFLAWKLYTMKALRLDRIAQSIVSHRAALLKEVMLDKWLFVLTAKRLQQTSTIIQARKEDWIKARALKQWQYAFDAFQDMNYKTLKATFFYWAKLVRDTKVTAEAVRKATNYLYWRQHTKILGQWHYITVVRLTLSQWECASRRRMLLWKAKKALEYWRLKCWWQGRRVLYSRVRLLHVPSKSKGVFFTNIASSAKHNFGILTASSYNQPPPILANLSRDISFSMHDRMFGGRTVAFMAPLAHEALLHRALRRWQKRIRHDLDENKLKMCHTTFLSWKRLTFVMLAKRAAFINRLLVFDNDYCLRRVFGALRSLISWNTNVVQCRKNFLRRIKKKYLHKWVQCLHYRRTRSQQVFLLKKTVKRIHQKSNSYKVLLAFKMWRLVCRSSPSLNLAGKMFLKRSWLSWRGAFLGIHYYRHSWMKKYFTAWKFRVGKLWRAYGSIRQLQHAIITIENR